MFGLCKKLYKRKEGSTAIEFAMLAVPYVMLSLGIIELSLMYTSASLLEGATDSAARLVRTGQLQQADGGEAMFRDALCNYATVLVNCEDIVVEVIPLASYNDFSGPVYNADGEMVSQGFDAGGSNDRMLIRTSYRFEMMTPLVGPLLNGEDGATTFISTIVLQTEPYEFQGA